MSKLVLNLHVYLLFCLNFGHLSYTIFVTRFEKTDLSTILINQSNYPLYKTHENPRASSSQKTIVQTTLKTGNPCCHTRAAGPQNRIVSRRSLREGAVHRQLKRQLPRWPLFCGALTKCAVLKLTSLVAENQRRKRDSFAAFQQQQCASNCLWQLELEFFECNKQFEANALRLCKGRFWRNFDVLKFGCELRADPFLEVFYALLDCSTEWAKILES